MSLRRILRLLRCALRLHQRFDVIQSFGSQQHVGCPDCGREWGIHHGMRVVVRWDDDLAGMYRRLGYEVDSSTARWRRLTRSEAAR